MSRESEELNKLGIEKLSYDMFDPNLYSESKERFPPPYHIMAFNSVYPHFRSDLVRKLIRLILDLRPVTFIIGGGTNGLEKRRFHALRTDDSDRGFTIIPTSWSARRQATMFKFDDFGNITSITHV